MTINDSHPSTPAEVERRARNLEALLQVSKTIASSLDLNHTLSATCRAAVELLAVEHSSLVLLSPDSDQAEVRAEYPEIGVRNLVIQFDETLKHARLNSSTEPVFIPDVREAAELGIIRQHMLDHDIQSTLIVPVESEKQVLGYFTLDTIGHTRRHTDEEIDLCKIFAAQTAVTIKNAQLYEETKQRAEQLDALRQTTLAVTSKLERDQLLNEIIDQAVGLLKAKKGGIFEHHPENQELTVIVGYYTGTTLRVGEGMAGRLACSDELFMIVDNYEEWPGRAPVEAGKRPSGAVLEVKIMWQGQIIGDLFVEADVPRKFTYEDAQLLLWFADQAAIAMNNAKLVRELREKQDNLASLSLAAQSLSGKIDPVEVLQRIAEQARASLNGDSATLWPYDRVRDEFLVDELVTVGIAGPELQEFKKQMPPPGGISRGILNKGWLGVEVVTRDFEFMRNTPRTDLLLRMGIKSFQGVVLRVGDEPVGVMYVNYNRERRFSVEDKRHMEWLATNAALALAIVRNARLFVGRELVALSEYFLTTLNRQEILDHAVQMARRLLKTDRGSIVLPDAKGRLLVVAEDGEPDVKTGKLEVERGRQSQTGYTIDTRKPKRVSDYEAETEFTRSDFLIEKGLKSGMSVPMLSKSKIVGAMLVHSRNNRTFTPAEEETLWEIANQTAIAIERCDEITRNTAYLSALHKASKAISEEAGKAIYERPFELQRVLYQIAKQTYECLLDSNGHKATLSTLQLYDNDAKELSFESAYPDGMLQKLEAHLGQKRPLVGVPNDKIGFAGLTALNGESLLIPDVRVGKLKEYYYEFLGSTRSELTVPMLDQDKVLGVLNVESDRLGAFDETDREELQALADFAVIAIRNAKQYKVLQHTQRLVSARNAVAFMGMASSIWGHSIRGYAINIRELVRTLRRDFKRTFLLPRKRSPLDEKLKRIETMATQILERPVIEPLGSDRGAENLPVNNLLKERIKQLRQTEPYASVSIELNLHVGGEVTVRCHPQWLRRALDILLDNAGEALSKVKPARRLLRISTAVVGNKVEIAIADTGPGIPPELQDIVLREQVKKGPGESGTGIGLLMAQAIINAYGGEISFIPGKEAGTTMVVSLPIVGME